MAARMTPLGAVARGVLAGVVGTAAMDLVWFARYRRGGGQSSFLDWELSAGLEGWEHAPAPALVGKRLYEGLFQRELKPEAARATNNVVHWATGAMWGSLFGLVAGSARRPRAAHGLALGPVAWAAGYVVLPRAGLYQPLSQYDPRTLGKDLSAHVVFGLGTSVAFRWLARRS